MITLGMTNSRKQKTHSVVLTDDLMEIFSLFDQRHLSPGTSDGWVGLDPEGWHGKERKSSSSRGQGIRSEAGLWESDARD